MKDNIHFQKYSNKTKRKRLIFTYFLGNTFMIVIILIFISGNNRFLSNFRQQFSQMIMAGIPIHLYLDVITDAEAVIALVTTDQMSFRNRLKELDIDTKIKNRYRSQFSNEVELEKHIDQIFYRYTGYANQKEYIVDQNGDLNLINKTLPQPNNFQQCMPKGLYNFIQPSSSTANSWQQTD